jgi:hypothetical protein
VATESGNECYLVQSGRFVYWKVKELRGCDTQAMGVVLEGPFG